jgi:hypothetical protein
MVFTTRDVILMDTQRLGDTYPLERERIHLLLLDSRNSNLGCRSFLHFNYPFSHRKQTLQ